MQNACWLTDVELVPTGTVFTPGSRVGAAPLCQGEVRQILLLDY